MAAVLTKPYADEGWKRADRPPLKQGSRDGVGTEPTVRVVPSCAFMVEFEQGLHVLDIGSTDDPARTSIQLSSPLDGSGQALQILTEASIDGTWLPGAGGTVVVKSPTGGGQLIVTAYANAGIAVPRLPEILTRRLDSDAPTATSGTASISDPSASAEIRTEIVLHIERLGDRRFPGEGWVGNRGGKLRIEALSIRPVEALTARDIQFRAFGPGGRETPWVTDGNLCGTRGRGIPLTGFAVRLAPPACDDYDVIYQGAFFESGVSTAVRNGDPCKSTIGDDPLEAIYVRIVERGVE